MIGSWVHSIAMIKMRKTYINKGRCKKKLIISIDYYKFITLIKKYDKLILLHFLKNLKYYKKNLLYKKKSYILNYSRINLYYEVKK